MSILALIHSRLSFVSHSLLQAQKINTMYFVNVCGGGFTGQAGAIRHGISRALLEVDAENRPILKKAGYLTKRSKNEGEEEVRSQGRSSCSTVLKEIIIYHFRYIKNPQKSNAFVGSFFKTFEIQIGRNKRYGDIIVEAVDQIR